MPRWLAGLLVLLLIVAVGSTITWPTVACLFFSCCLFSQGEMIIMHESFPTRSTLQKVLVRFPSHAFQVLGFQGVVPLAFPHPGAPLAAGVAGWAASGSAPLSPSKPSRVRACSSNSVSRSWCTCSSVQWLSRRPSVSPVLVKYTS